LSYSDSIGTASHLDFIASFNCCQLTSNTQASIIPLSCKSIVDQYFQSISSGLSGHASFNNNSKNSLYVAGFENLYTSSKVQVNSCLNF